VLSERVHVEYKCTAFYDREDEFGVAWNDPEIGIRWPLPSPALSAKDASAPRLAEILELLPVLDGPA
jgi:dTDP-4-dehydrorhamnose 3,5-epimerase